MLTKLSNKIQKKTKKFTKSMDKNYVVFDGSIKYQ